MLWKESRRGSVTEPEPPAGAEVSVPCAALTQFFRRVARVQPDPLILVVGELCGANISFLGERGYRVRVESDVRSGPEGSCAGALIWDTFSLMPHRDARRRTARLLSLLVPGGAVLACLPPPGTAASRPRARYRILSEGLVGREIVPGRLARPYAYQNREIISIFEGFDLELLHTHRSGHRDALFFKPRRAPETG